MIQGSVVWNEANCFLHRLYEEIYGDFIPPSLTINGVVHHPRSVADIVRLHVDDTPVLGDWKTLYHVYVFNIANFSGRKSVVPEKLRRKISRAILFNVSDLASALARMGGREDMHDGVSAIANRLHARHAFKSGANQIAAHGRNASRVLLTGLVGSLIWKGATPHRQIGWHRRSNRRGLVPLMLMLPGPWRR